MDGQGRLHSCHHRGRDLRCPALKRQGRLTAHASLGLGVRFSRAESAIAAFLRTKGALHHERTEASFRVSGRYLFGQRNRTVEGTIDLRTPGLGNGVQRNRRHHHITKDYGVVCSSYRHASTELVKERLQLSTPRLPRARRDPSTPQRRERRSQCCRRRSIPMRPFRQFDRAFFGR